MGNSVSSVWNSKAKPVVQSSAISVKSASSSDSGSTKSLSISKPAAPVKSGKSYILNHMAALQESKDKSSKWIANLTANSKVYVDYVDHNLDKKWATSEIDAFFCDVYLVKECKEGY